MVLECIILSEVTPHTFQAEGKLQGYLEGYMWGVLHLGLPCGCRQDLEKRAGDTGPCKAAGFCNGDPLRHAKVKHFQKKITIQSFPKFQDIHLRGWRDGFSNEENLLLFQRTKVPFPAPHGSS